jgi:RND family efflux transporter MFP subunit
MLRTLGVLTVVGGITLTGVLTLRRHTAVTDERRTREAVVAQGVPVLVAPVKQVDPGRRITLPGELRPYRVTTVYAKTSGYLKAIYVDKGDRVKSGQALGLVESPETDQQVLSTQADLGMKRQIYDRYRALVGKGVVSAQEMDNAAAALHSAEAELERLRALKDYETIRAPFDGIVTARYADPGALMPAATGATQSAQPLVEVQDMSKVRIFVYVAQTEAPYIREGDPVQIASQENASVKVQAKVTRTTHALDLRTRTMLVEVDLDNKEGLLYPGLFVDATLQVDSPAMLTMPSDAVFLRNGQSMVAVVDDGVAKYTPVEIASDDGHIVHVASGLRAGQMVGLHVGDAVSDGAKVKPFEAKASNKPH